MIASLVSSTLFLPHQSLWNDEATQMCGVGLDPVEVTRWLAGVSKHDFGVPDDRMPPVSFWAQWTWSKVFGQSERALRCLSMLVVSLATVLVFNTARRNWGMGAGLAAGFLLALSPNVVGFAPEIRAYPFFLLESALMYAFFSRLLEDRPSGDSDRGPLAGLIATAILACYTHFFGLVLSGAVVLALLILGRDRPGQFRRAILAMLLIGIAAAGLLPFVMASANLGGGGSSVSFGSSRKLSIVPVIRLIYRMISHPSIYSSTVMTAVAMAGAVAASLAALASKRTSERLTAGLIISMVSGLFVACVTNFLQSKFEAASIHYNVWIFPALCLLLASGQAARSGFVRFCSLTGIGMLLAADLYGVGRMAIDGDYFAHTSYGQVARLIDRLAPARVAVVYDQPSPEKWHIYSPMWYVYGPRVPQFAYESTDARGGIRLASYPRKQTEFEITALDADYVIVVKPKKEGADELKAQLRDGPSILGDGPVTRALLGSPGWRRTEEGTYPSYVACDIDLFEKNGLKPTTPDDRPSSALDGVRPPKSGMSVPGKLRRPAGDFEELHPTGNLRDDKPCIVFRSAGSGREMGMEQDHLKLGGRSSVGDTGTSVPLPA